MYDRRDLQRRLGHGVEEGQSRLQRRVLGIRTEHSLAIVVMSDETGSLVLLVCGLLRLGRDVSQVLVIGDL